MATAKPVTPFTFVDAVGFSKKNVFDSVSQKNYVPFIINKAFSYHQDSIFYAEEMNLNGHLPSVMQHAFYLNILPPKRRFAKWAKGADKSDFNAVAQYFCVNMQKAEQMMDLLSANQIETIRTMVDNHDGQVRQIGRDYS